KEFGRFGAVELKDFSTHNVVSSVVADGCVNGVTFGSETSSNPTLNILSNIIARNPSSFGLHAGDGDNNLFNGAIVDCAGSEGTQIGAITTDGENNAFTDVLISGLSGTSPSGGTYVPYPIRFLPSAKNNYASTFAQYSTDNLATFALGAVRNFVEIKHPGNRVDIFDKSSYITGRESIDASANSNVLHAPALGMYFGTMSGRYEWRYKIATMPASTLFSSDRFRFTGDGDIFHAIGGGSASGVKLFKSNGEYRTLSFDSSDRLRLGLTKTAWIQFGTDSVVTSLDNTVALGQPSLRYSVLYAGTGTINTSDSREKTEPEKISDEVLDAWGDVQFIAYRWLHMVAEKGDSARVHYGLIAQQVRDAFIARGLDGTRYGLLCYDSWPDKYESVRESRFNQSGVEELHETGEQRLVLAAGDRWGIRPDQCLFLEAAYQRRRSSRMEIRLKRLEDLGGLDPLPQ
ncbi:tail fiber domain-containing protein, partial [Comamonas testosteroni]